MSLVGHEDAFPRPRLNARCRFSKGPSRGRGATGEKRRQQSLAGRVGRARLASQPTFVSQSGQRILSVPGSGECTTRISSSRQLIEERLRLLQVGGVEAFGKPAIDRGDEVAGFGAPALLAPQPGEIADGAQFE